MQVDLSLNRESYFPGDLLHLTIEAKNSHATISTPKKRGSTSQQNLVEWIVLQTVGILNFDSKFVQLNEKQKDKNTFQSQGMSFRNYVDTLGMENIFLFFNQFNFNIFDILFYFLLFYFIILLVILCLFVFSNR